MRAEERTLKLAGADFGEDFCYIVRANVELGDGRHGQARIQVLLKDSFNNFAGLLGSKASFKDNVNIYIEGTITCVRNTPSYLANLAEVWITAGSIEIDKETQKRVFQAPDKKLSDILKKSTPDGFTPKCPHDFELKEIVIQDAETPYTFMRRLAHECGLPLFFSDTDASKKRFTLGALPGSAVKIEQEDILHISVSYVQDDKIGRSLVLDALIWQPPGTVIDVADCQYVIMQARLIHKDNYLYYSYDCVEKKDPEQPEQKKYKLFLGRAKVADNHDPDHFGRLRLEYLDYEDSLPGERPWLSYLTPLTEKNLGMIYIPDKDEVVEVYCRDNDCIALACRREAAIPDPYQEIGDRMLCLRDKHLIFYKDMLEFSDATNIITVEKEEIRIENKNSVVRLRDDAFSLAIKNKDKPQITVDGDTVLIKTNSAIKLETKDAVIQTDGDFGAKSSKKIVLDASGKAGIKGSSVDIETSSFNVG